MQKKCQVFILPTEKASNLFIAKSYEKLYYGNPSIIDVDYQHLYVLSDEEIKEGDWVILTSEKINNGNSRLFQNLHGAIGSVMGSKSYIDSHFKKIIATTNPELKMFGGYGSGDTHEEAAVYESLPSLRQDFIEAYVKEYNTGIPIQEVAVEYNIYNGHNEYSYSVVLRPDGTIIVRRIKNDIFI